jgi:3'-phosphoadenosine 5'-phosphosulfate sulfotransferase (PAPS reductase)/FAD synthetase
MKSSNIVSFSGGKDSTAMLLMMIEKGLKIDRIINIDTTKEFPQMYEHIKKVQEYIKPYGLKIETVKIPFDYYLSEHIKIKGKNKGKFGYGWPDFKNRWCTALKREVSKKVVNNTNIIEFQGIAFDEEKRLNNNKGKRNIRYPLAEWYITEKQALQYCYDKGFNWGGLYEKMSRVSCWCCPLSRLGELKILYTDFPNLWQELKQMDKESFRQFRSDYSVEDLELKFKKELRENEQINRFF